MERMPKFNSAIEMELGKLGKSKKLVGTMIDLLFTLDSTN